jgi:16S rRNA (guanine966-N2)-methyltransferase
MRIISGKARGTKLNTLEGLETRPTLDRVKESLFNIINYDLQDAYVLDLFAGSGAIGLESLSRGAKEVVLCDNSKDAVKIINQNIQKTHFEEKAKVYNLDFEACLKKLKGQVFDIIYIDPPYDTDFAVKSVQAILEFKMINENSIVIIETDDKQRILESLEKIDIEVDNVRKYGRANLIFLKL